ncbi:hypothetical protein [Nocardioides sp.]|uniref:hypothetical protein n=1 Tax=Nocardioides sp. TaxID=35761 RepID=UPI0019BB7BC8|nr:hypothetical protein [Nocardioides sp.]MBC7279263.1 hypothetical protein [Nocardioides sp.]
MWVAKASLAAALMTSASTFSTADSTMFSARERLADVDLAGVGDQGEQAGIERP